MMTIDREQTGQARSATYTPAAFARAATADHKLVAGLVQTEIAAAVIAGVAPLSADALAILGIGPEVDRILRLFDSMP